MSGRCLGMLSLGLALISAAEPFELSGLSLASSADGIRAPRMAPGRPVRVFAVELVLGHTKDDCDIQGRERCE